MEKFKSIIIIGMFIYTALSAKQKGGSGMLSEMFKYLETKSLGRNCFYFDELDSTSTYLKKRWKLFSHGHTVASLSQLNGRGRQGKSFYSPKGAGLYFSFLLTEEKYVCDPLFTVKISYALCRAIDALTETQEAKIKWVNDIYVNGRKVAGILCEALKDQERNGILVGIGVNLSIDKASVPQELRGKIGSLRDLSKKKLNAWKLLALILNETEKIYSEDYNENFLELYKARSAVLGREIMVIKGEERIRAAALDIADDAGLNVRYQNGITEKLTAGEISIYI